MVFKNDRQRKAVMSRLMTKMFRVKVPVYTEIDTLVNVREGTPDEDIMAQAVKKAEREEPEVAWQFDSDRAMDPEGLIEAVPFETKKSGSYTKPELISEVKRDYERSVTRLRSKTGLTDEARMKEMQDIKLVLDANIKNITRA